MAEIDFPALLKRFAELGSSTVGGALDNLGIDTLVVPPIRPVAQHQRFAGRAFTVKVVVGRLGTFEPSEFTIPAYIDKAPGGDVIVIDAGGAPVSMMGGAAALVAKQRGVAAIVVDGGVRDLDEIVASELPMFIRHAVPVSGKTRAKTVATNVPVKIGDVSIAPGDIIVGDSTGVVVVPVARAQEVLELCEKADAFDRKMMENIRNGMNLGDAARTARGG